MSISRNLKIDYPAGAGVPQTTADMIAAFRYTFSLPNVQCSPQLKNFLSEMGMVARRCASSVGKDPEDAKLEALVACDEKLTALLRGLAQEPNYIARHLNYKDKMLAYAYSVGWTCCIYERKLQCMQAWEQVSAVLHGDAEGCLSIVKEAERMLKGPSDVDEEFLTGWRKSRFGRLPQTVEEQEARFRAKMRQAGLESLFPHLDLSNRLPSRISIPDEAMPAALCQQIEDAVRYKTDPTVKGRPGKKRVKPRTGNHIRTALRELCGFAISTIGIKPTGIADVLTLEVICAWIAMLRKRGALPTGIRSRLGCIRFIFKTDFVPKGDYRWFGRELRKLRSEPRWRLDERQRDKSIAYEDLAEVPQRIRALRVKGLDRDPQEIAWLVHDELFSTWPLHLPWRFCSIAETGLFPPAFTNIVYAELTDAMKADSDLPRWVRQALTLDKHQRFLQFNFGKSQCKNNHMVREIVPLELTGLYWEYLNHHRKFIVDKEHDDGTLFLNRRGRRLTSDTARDLYSRLVRNWIGLVARPHLTRDSYCEYRLAHGDTVRQLKRKLWHRFLISTERYCRRYDTSHGALALGRRLERARLNRKAA
jgi:hypothetical protein